jgi:23S rRNA maturation mini-RNase III
LYHLGAEVQGAVTCKLGAAVYDAEVRVYFLKSFQNRRVCEILLKKGKNNKDAQGAGILGRGAGARWWRESV